LVVCRFDRVVSVNKEDDGIGTSVVNTLSDIMCHAIKWVCIYYIC